MTPLRGIIHLTVDATHEFFATAFFWGGDGSEMGEKAIRQSGLGVLWDRRYVRVGDP